MATDLAQLHDEVIARGYIHDFSAEAESLLDERTSDRTGWRELRIVGSESFDNGTDPGDDVTLYLIEGRSGQKGYLILSDSFHCDPHKAAFIDTLLAQSSSQR